MGIPKFFRYISERYPCLTEKLKDYQIAEFDNLYLDVNGIIHECSHPDDGNVSFRISEETIFRNVFRYLELLFRMIQPQKLFFVAVDGVAPRAKINQQRSRRFRSAKDAQILEAKALAKGVELPQEKRFDSNCITPGTLFMSKLDEQLKYFITYKISTDKLWQNCKVIFSGSQVPGEGEHKIMDYIRYMKAQPDYDINTKHCLYGLDADLIMLGLCTHEIHFTLLREEVIFGKKQKKVCLTPEETKFCLFHVSLLRDYIDHEFSSLKDKLPFTYDLEKIIDDWVLMCFLVGNDFIPHLPNLHIAHCALSVLSQVYMNVLPTLDGYINESGTLRLDRFEKFMERLSRFDEIHFSERYADLKYFESKTGRPLTKASDRLDQGKSENSEETSKRMPDKEFDALLRSAAEMSLGRYDDEEEDDESDCETYIMEFVQCKRDYYMNKLKLGNIDEDFLRSQAEGYVRAIQWNLHYYYNGCCSWSWYYPHHYAPYISDIKDFKDLKLEFELGEPFLPFEQLLAVLPPYSKDLLPSAFQQLLTEEQSPIINYYPAEFQTDLNGKEQEWEAVVLIPFINEKHLQDAMAPHYAKLTAEEQARNKHGPMSLYSYSDVDFGLYKAPEYFPDIISHAQVQLINREDIIIPPEKLVRGLCPGVKLDVYYPGFSTLQYVNHTARLEKAKVKVFQRPSHWESMILHITPPSKTSLSTVESNFLGRTVYINWPHLKEALVVGVSDSHSKFKSLNSQARHFPETVNEDNWNKQVRRIAETYKTTMGVDVGDIKFLVHVRPLEGKKHIFGTHGKLHMEKQWSETETCCAYQTIVKDIVTQSNSLETSRTVSEIFVPGTVCFMLGHPYYGAIGRVQKPGVCKKSGRVKVSVMITREPSFEAIKQVQADTESQYMHGRIVSLRLGIKGIVLSRITGSLFVKQASNESQQDETTHNIGLRLKSFSKNEEAPGYTRKSEHGNWFYSTKTVDLVRNYMVKCPELFERLALNATTKIFQEEQLFNKGSGELNDVVTWLKEELKDVENCTCGKQTIDSSIVKRIEEEVDTYLKTSNNFNKFIEIQVQPYLLYTPKFLQRNLPPDAKAQTQLLDRICCTKENFTVPIGSKGTVIGIQKSESISDTMYDVLFDKTFVGGLSISGSSDFRAYRLSSIDFINISHGERVGHGRGTMDANTESMEPWNSMSNQEAQLRANASAFASYKNKNHLPMEPPFSPRPRIIQKNPNNQQNAANVREPYKMAKGAHMNMQRKSLVAVPTSEFQAIWNELHKKQEPNKVPQQPSMGFKGKQINKDLSENSPQDPSAFLKAMLKIPDGNAQQVIQAVTSKTPKRINNTQKESETLDTPPLVQQLFDHARKNEKVKDDKTPTWYCSQLLNYYQLIGVGMPQYSYVADAGTNLIRAHILLPDKRIFAGDPSANHEQAAGSAAKKVYMELKLANVLPNIKTLLPPPQHWYSASQNSNWSQNIRPPMVPPYHASEPKLLQLFPEWVQKGYQNPGHQDMQKHNEKYRHYVPPKLMNNKSKPEGKNCPTFVPLQAQKKSRHVTVKQDTRKGDTNQSAKDNPQVIVQQRKDESPPKMVKVEAATAINDKGKKSVQSSSNQVQNAQAVARPKKSRVAARFGISTQVEETNHSKSST